MIGELTNHLWQSTVFAVVVGLLAIALRKNRARVRYCLWLSASLKFFVPFALLISLGRQLESVPAAQQLATQVATPAVSYTVEQLTEPFSEPPVSASEMPAAGQATATEWLPMTLFSVWLCGFAGVVMMRIRAWLKVRAALRASTPVEVDWGVSVRASSAFFEPGVVGALRPTLLLPEGIVNRLTASQLEAIVAHELCHVRRRDNLTSALHMIAEAVFWFHPLVWWIGARLVAERERACDEEVLRLGNEPMVYAEGILNICKFYQRSPLMSVPGVTGSDLKKRIEDIMMNRGVLKLGLGKAVLLALVGVLTLTGPIAMGVVKATALRALAVSGIPMFTVAPPRFEIASMLQTPPAQANAAPAALVQQEGLSGKWGTGVPGVEAITGPDIVTMEFKVGGGRVTGSITRTEPPGQAPVIIDSGTATANTITFTVKSPDGRRTITLTGQMKGDEIEFTREAKGTGGGYGFYGLEGPKTLTARRITSVPPQGNAAPPPRLKFAAASVRPVREDEWEARVRNGEPGFGFIRCLGVDGMLALMTPNVRDPTARRGRCIGNAVDLRFVVYDAYASRPLNVHLSQRMAGYPPSMERDHYFQIEGVADDPERVTKGELKLMLQTLLEDRFKARVHLEMRETDGFVLSAAKSGIKFKETSDEATTGRGNFPPILNGKYTMGRFLQLLQQWALDGVPIADKTGLTGVYDIKFELEEIPVAVPADCRGCGGTQPTQFTTPVAKALESQLGLHLERVKVPAEFVVIDHLEQPTEN
jgi:uncharacterized protein (TIGR03435 family)